MRHIVLFTLAIGISTGGIGCGKLQDKLAEKAAEKAAEKVTGGKVDIKNDGQGLSFETKNAKGETVTLGAGAGAKVPDAFPKEVPIYPGAKVTSAITVGGNFMVTLSTTDAQQKVIDHYKSNLKGFKEEAAADTGEAKVHTGKSDKLSVTVTASRGGGDAETTVTLAVAALPGAAP